MAHKKKTEAINRAKGKLHKVHHSAEYCRHCGEKTSTSTRHESGHREYDHEKMEDIKNDSIR